MLKVLALVVALVFLPTSVWANDETPQPVPSTALDTPQPIPSDTLEWDQTPVPGSENWGQPPRTLDPVFNIPGGSYTPPPEASQGAGGWAIVHPVTGVVLGVITGTIDTYYGNNGRMQTEYMGCPAGCLLRFQTRATSDGNIAGWHGPEVTFDKNDDTFALGYSNTDSNGTTTVKQKLIPARTATDGANLSTGLVNIRTEFISSRLNDLAIKLVKLQEYQDSDSFSEIEISGYKTFTYESDEQVVQNLDSDITDALTSDGYDVEVPESGGFVETVRTLTEKVKRYFVGFFSSE